MKYLCLLLFPAIYSSHGDRRVRRYKPEWGDLDARPLPEWYDRAKVGIFLHWGVYSVPAYGYGSEWFWFRLAKGHNLTKEYMDTNYPPGYEYRYFAPSFTAKCFDPYEWADLFKKAGAKYVVLTSKHHDGFKLFPSKHNAFSNWNSVDVGPRRNLIKDLSKAVRGNGLEFGVYYSLFEWFNPIYLKDEAANFSTNKFVRYQVRPDIEQLVNDYRPSIIWSDGDAVAPDTYWNSTDILTWLYNDSPVKDKIVVNDRWGINTNGKHGDFYNHADRFHPGTLQKHKWESAFTVDKFSWGYRRNMRLSEILTLREIINFVVIAVSCGGNVLINVGPTKDGTIKTIFKKRLVELGKWLGINGEAIYNSSPWLHQNDSFNSGVWYTCRRTKYNATNPTALPLGTHDVAAIYAIILRWPQHNNTLTLKSITSTLLNGYYYIEMLGQGSKALEWTVKNGKINIVLPNKATVWSKQAWTLKFTGNDFSAYVL